jgi:hypothetical protein
VSDAYKVVTTLILFPVSFVFSGSDTMVMMIFMLASPSVPQAITEVPGGVYGLRESLSVVLLQEWMEFEKCVLKFFEPCVHSL